MGTRSLTFVHEDNNPEPIICIYQQYDGHFSGVGDDILSFLKGKVMVNGFGGGDLSKQFNGAGDLACRLVTHFKRGDEDDVGGVYIMDPTLSDDGAGAEFAYHIHCAVGSEPRLTARDVYAKTVVSGLVSEIVWPSADDEDDVIDDQFIIPAQRAALFVTFNEVFGSVTDEQRYAFTRMVLGLTATATVSWSEHRHGALTVAEASKVLDALDALNV